MSDTLIEPRVVDVPGANNGVVYHEYTCSVG